MDKLQAGERGKGLQLFKDAPDCIAHRIERSNCRISVANLCDREKYINGNVDYFFEFVYGRRDGFADVIPEEFWIRNPSDVSPVTPHDECPNIGRERWVIDKNAEISTHDGFIVFYWNQEPMFIYNLHLVHEEKDLVPSLIKMGFQFCQYVSQSLSASDLTSYEPLGESVARGFLKPVQAFTEGKLDVLFDDAVARSAIIDETGKYLPVCVVKRFPEVSDRVTGNCSESAHRGFVIFDIGGSPIGLCIRLKDISERRIISQYFGKISDMFRSPIKL